jgi:hypothetical protein
LFPSHWALTHSPAATDPCKIVTLLIAPAWQAMLEKLDIFQQFQDIPTGLTQGFRLGASHLLTHTFTPPNHSSALDQPDIVDAHILSELSLGRYSGPFERSTLFSLIGHFCSAPLGVVSKSTPGEYRIIQDFSYPQNHADTTSVNAEINVDKFPCLWSFFDDVAQALLSGSPDSQAATLDVHSAYHRMPIHPDDQPSIVVSWKEKFYVDHCAPFGAASSNGIFGRCGNAMQLIISKSLNVSIFKWVDDFLIIRPSPGFPGGSTSLQDIYNLTTPLGWPWKDSKTCPFAPNFTYCPNLDKGTQRGWCLRPYTDNYLY